MGKNIFSLFIFSSFCILNAQNVEFSGYLNDMPSGIWLNQPKSTFFWQNNVHNRLNFGWQINKYFHFDASTRTRLLTGSSQMLDASEISVDKGVVDLSWNVFAGEKTALNLSLDRLNFTFEKNKISLTLGRQRINWGQNFVWNPNDIFNTYSFFDFDYPERAGCDALRAIYYQSAVASSELAVSIAHKNEITAAAMHRWNWKNIDFQVIAGVINAGGTKFSPNSPVDSISFNPADLILGGAWSGDIKGISCRGEFSYFHSLEKNTDFTPQNVFSASVGMDYSFSNSLFLQTEFYYNTINRTNGLMDNGIMGIYSQPLSAKNLSFAQWNIFIQASYPFSPRLNGSISSIYYPDRNGFYAGFSLNYSLVQNLDLAFFMQTFYISLNPKPLECILGFVRLKYSF